MAQRVAVVTGGMGGIGEAICACLAKAGHRVVATYSPGNTRAGEWVKDMKARGFEFHAVQVDVDEAGHDERAAQIQARGAVRSVNGPWFDGRDAAALQHEAS